MRAETRSPAVRPRRVGMVVFDDITYDSRVRKEAATLANAGYDVLLVCLAADGSRTDLPDNVVIRVMPAPRKAITPGLTNPFVATSPGRITALRRRASWLLAYFRGLREWGRMAVAAAGSVDAWHAHDLTALVAVAPSVSKATPIVYDSHELYLETGTVLRLPKVARHLLRSYERHLIGRTSAVITVNDEIAAILARRYRPRRAVVVHNCPDLRSEQHERSTLIREAARIPATSPVLLYHGGLTNGRGIELLFQAIAAQGLEHVHLVLMGQGDKREELELTARSTPSSGRIHVLDPVPPSDLLRWVSSADVGVIPNPGLTLNDRLSSPNKLFECLAAGTPVVGSDFPTMRRIIVADASASLGAVCDPASAGALAEAIRSIVSLEPTDVQELRARCLRAAIERWNWQRESQQLLALYRDVAPLVETS